MHVTPLSTRECLRRSHFSWRSFNYRGVIIGFDRSCKQTDAWVRSMNVDNLKHGRHQPFYHVLPDARDRLGAQVRGRKLGLDHCISESMPIESEEGDAYCTIVSRFRSLLSR